MTVKEFDFSHYYTYQELKDYLSYMKAEFPELIKLQVIGQSYQGRDIQLAILTKHSTGNYLEKPAYWIDANTHAAEVTGSAVACYIIYYLLTQFQKDAQVTHLLEHHTLYVLPRLAVDGAEIYLTTPHKVRSSIRPYPYPDEQDGLHRQDINGDGLILQMRIKDDCGAWKISEHDSRLMVRRNPSEFGDTYYTLLPEGLIRNYDGYTITLAPPLGGVDFNRNYPHQWSPESQQKGAGEFPFSEPETRAEAEFWHQHRNINGFISYHTYSAVILRPYGTHPDEYFPIEDLEIYTLIGDQGTKITGYNCVSVYHDFRYPPKEVIYGSMDDYAYDHFGWFGFTIELWDAPTAAGIEKENFIQWFRWHSPEDALKLLQWNDAKLGGKGFIDWQPFHHPQVGAVEIGGWDEKAVWQNAPPEYLPELCDKHCRFAIAHALMSPRLALARTKVTYQGGDIYHVVVQWENQGFLPTYTSKKALERQSVRPIEVTLSLPAAVTLVSGQLKQNIQHLEGRANKAFELIAQGTDNRRHVDWVLQGAAGCEIEITAVAERAGTVRCRLRLENN